MPGPNYAAECGIKCGEPRFQRFLKDATKLQVSDKDEAAVAVRQLCKIKSRAELNSSEEAAERWKRVRHWFELWMAGHGTNAAGNRHKPNIMGRVAFQRGTMIGGNPFPRPDIDEDEETDFDLWEHGWRKAARENAS